MKLARPYRRAPLEIARALAEAIAADAADPAATRRSRRSRSRRRGSSTCAWPTAPSRRRSAAILAEPAGWGRVPPVRPRTVNVEFVSANPTGPLTIGNARGAFVGDLLCRVLEAGGQAVTREYYFNDFGAQVSNLGASVLAIRRGRADPRGRLPRRLRRGPRARACPDDVWAAAEAPGADRGRRSSAAGRPSASGPGSRRASTGSGSTSTSGRPRARCTPRAGSSGRSSGCGRAATSTSRTGRCGSARPPSATTRTG